ncbi:MAG: hypothetical protein KC656_05230 [Myxococcales bacterium]|nr:hypothetical protein [Myxococcales bacterium]MCB9693963.1 hypothetical protein [Alphaproteobacteria bacterium]
MIVVLLACRADRPVPIHPGLDAVRAAVVDEDPVALGVALEPFLAPATGVREPAGSAWVALGRVAGELRAATVRSERSTGYARLVVTCAACHAGQPPPAREITGHGPALQALDDAVVYGSPERYEAAIAGIASSPSLTGSQERFLELARRVESLPEPPEKAWFLAKLYGECIRCHGPSSPLKLRRP